MSFKKVNHSVQLAFDETVAASDNSTGDWIDVNGQVDKTFSVDLDDTGTADVTIEMHVSPFGYYELNNMTATTEHYEAIQVVANLATETLVRYTKEDLADIDESYYSIRFKVTNNDQTTGTAVKIYVDGKS